MALLDSGRMVASGSPDDIKKRFGIGYNLVITHNECEEDEFRVLVESMIDRADSKPDK